MNPDLPPSPNEEQEAKLTALLLGELDSKDAEKLRNEIAKNPELRQLHDRLEQTIALVREAVTEQPSKENETAESLQLSGDRRSNLLRQFKVIKPQVFVTPWLQRWYVPFGITAALVLFLGGTLVYTSLESSWDARYARANITKGIPRQSSRIQISGQANNKTYGRIVKAEGSKQTDFDPSAWYDNGVVSEESESFGKLNEVAKGQKRAREHGGAYLPNIVTSDGGSISFDVNGRAPITGQPRASGSDRYDRDAIVADSENGISTDQPTRPEIRELELGTKVTFTDQAESSRGSSGNNFASTTPPPRALASSASRKPEPKPKPKAVEALTSGTILAGKSVADYGIRKAPAPTTAPATPPPSLEITAPITGLPDDVILERDYQSANASELNRTISAGGGEETAQQFGINQQGIANQSKLSAGFDVQAEAEPSFALPGNDRSRRTKAFNPRLPGQSANVDYFELTQTIDSGLQRQSSESQIALGIDDELGEPALIARRSGEKLEFGNANIAGDLFDARDNKVEDSQHQILEDATSGSVQRLVRQGGLAGANAKGTAPRGEPVQMFGELTGDTARAKVRPLAATELNSDLSGPADGEVLERFSADYAENGGAAIDQSQPWAYSGTRQNFQLDGLKTTQFYRSRSGEMDEATPILQSGITPTKELEQLRQTGQGAAHYNALSVDEENLEAEKTADMSKRFVSSQRQAAAGRYNIALPDGREDTIPSQEWDVKSVTNEGKPASDPTSESEMAKQAMPEFTKLKELDALNSQLEAKQQELIKAKKIRRKDAEDLATKRSPSAPIPQPEVQTTDNAFSTFSLNVADVSFKLAAASLERGTMPDVATVRSEEFINALDYRDPMPRPGQPIAFAWERARYPFAHNRDLLRFSVQTAARGREPGRPLNLVLLLDNSGSMERADRVRIIQECLLVLAAQLQPQDRVSVVTFARTARLWADGLPGNTAAKSFGRVGTLTPQGGTNLEEAMNLAYQTALRHYLPQGVNRVVVLTDGAANLGNVDPEGLKQKVEAFRKQGVALDCFGIGWEGYNDDLLEILSRNGDGRYGFVNSPEAATTEFAGQLAGALQVAASDVKVQVEFNPRRVTTYRQIGYAKHQLKKEQFRDNTVDAAEIGAAESGNALYAVQVDPHGQGPLAVVRVRYKVPGTRTYHEREWAVPYDGEAAPLAQASPAMRLAASASAFSEWLASSPYAAEVTTDRLLNYLSGVPAVYGADPRPKQLEWMIRQAKSIAGR